MPDERTLEVYDPPIRQSEVCSCNEGYCVPHRHDLDKVHNLWLCRPHEHVVEGEPFDPEQSDVRET